MSANNKLFGILGGMGPLASAEFLKTIYQYSITDLEQHSPACVLYSDPTFPDRSKAILSGEEQLLLDRLVSVLEKLSALDVGRIVITCITTHSLLDRLPMEYRDKIISLVDLIIDEVVAVKRRPLLLCTRGTRAAHTFEKHPRWHQAAPYILLPDDNDQQIIHDLIYQLKINSDLELLFSHFDKLLKKYRANAFIAGCTEIHLLSKYLIKEEQIEYQIIDPLITLAKHLRRFLEPAE